MKLHSGFILLFFVASSCFARDISRQTLDELELLLKQFKKSASTNLKTDNNKAVQEREKLIDVSTDVSTNELINPLKSKCASKCRHAFADCFAFSNTADERQKCADIFISCFPKCFFGMEPEEGHPDEFICRGNCLRRYDQCIFDAKGRPEQLSCYNYRGSCFGQCPHIEVSSLEKRELVCQHQCDVDYEMCYQSADQPEIIMMCISARKQCTDRDFC